jgi:hypothetical protein
MEKELNEDCGCGAGKTHEPKMTPMRSNYNDPNVGKTATLFDGRQALVDDSIKNSSGAVIGYVLNNGTGAFRVFKDKIQNFSESEGAMSTLSATPGMGDVSFPTAGHLGSGDKFPSLGVGGSQKKVKKERKKNQFVNKLMDFTNFSKTMKKFQEGDKGNKK